MSFYPEKLAVSKSEDAVNEVADAQAIIALMESGASEAYALKSMHLKEGDKLAPHEICSIVLAGRNCPAEMAQLYQKVESEKITLSAVSPAKFSTQTAFVAELTEKAEFADPAVWLAKLKEVNSVTTWTDLKAVYEPELEPIAVEK